MTREESSRIDNLATMVGGCAEGLRQLAERMDRDHAEHVEYRTAAAEKMDAIHDVMTHAQGWISFGKWLAGSATALGALGIAIAAYFWPPKGH